MSKKHPHHPGGSDRDRDRERHYGGEVEPEFENDLGNAAHIEIEERRFREGVQPTPELYARAREQWNRLPGSVMRSPSNPMTRKPPADSEAKPSGGDKDKKDGSQ